MTHMTYISVDKSILFNYNCLQREHNAPARNLNHHWVLFPFTNSKTAHILYNKRGGEND